MDTNGDRGIMSRVGHLRGTPELWQENGLWNGFFSDRAMSQMSHQMSQNATPVTFLVRKMENRLLVMEKIGDLEKLEILVQHQSFWNIVGARPTAAPRNSGRDNAAGIMIVWRTSPPLILHIDWLKKVAAVTLSHVPLRRHATIITIFHGFGTNCVVPSDWDSAPRFVSSPNFLSDFYFENLFPAAMPPEKLLGFDPCTPLVFNLYHHLERNLHFVLVPQPPQVLSARSFLKRVRHPNIPAFRAGIFWLGPLFSPKPLSRILYAKAV